jgi:hypothetical protein
MFYLKKIANFTILHWIGEQRNKSARPSNEQFFMRMLTQA